MLILNSTSKSFTAVLGEAANTNEPVFTAAYALHTAISFTEESNEGEFNGTTDIEIMPAPAANERSILRSLTIFNADDIDHTFNLQIINDSGTFVFNSFTLSPNSFYFFNPSGQAATDPGFTPGVSAPIQRTILYTDINDVASTSKQIEECSMEAKEYIYDLFIHVKTAFTGGSISSLNWFFRNGSNTGSSAIDLFTAGGDQVVRRCSWLANRYQSDMVNSWTFNHLFNSAGANLNACTAGECVIIYRKAFLP